MRIGLILGDQLSLEVATLQSLNKKSDRLVMAEVKEEATYVPHHPQKIAFIFSAMRHFAQELEASGWQVSYFKFDSQPGLNSLLDACQQVVSEYNATELVVTECGEFRLQQEMDSLWAKQLEIPICVLPDSRFFCSRSDFAKWAKGRKQLRMEFFYREMRRRTGVLMTAEGGPEGDRWNFDGDNRKPYKGEHEVPAPYEVKHDVIDEEVLTLVAAQFSDHYGRLLPFRWATTRRQAQAILDDFIEHRLPFFGDYQDAMVTSEPFLFHSVLSPYMNCGLLDPKAVCEKVVDAYREGLVPLNSAEGFVRQVLGWREYVRGIYWLCMPGYAALNALGNTQALPGFYWTAKTKMNCMAQCIGNTLDHAYAHHIQRLMVTGNFALLVGVQPKEICDWYLAVYADAYDWVELPNTLGMVMHADGGYLGSKPYAASGKYIHRMSDFCKNCVYTVKTAEQEDSCPFNSLYWHFVQRHRKQLGDNPRMAMIYRSLDRMENDKVDRILSRAEHLLNTIEDL